MQDHLYVKKFTVVYDFDSIKLRRMRVKGVGTVNQTETMIAVTAHEPLCLPPRRHKHYLDFNTGSAIAVVKLQPFAATWTMSFDEKKQLYGKLRLPVGGRESHDSGGEEEDDADAGPGVPPTLQEFASSSAKKPSVRSGENIEPVSYYAMPFEF